MLQAFISFLFHNISTLRDLYNDHGLRPFVRSQFFSLQFSQQFLLIDILSEALLRYAILWDLVSDCINVNSMFLTAVYISMTICVLREE